MTKKKIIKRKKETQAQKKNNNRKRRVKRKINKRTSQGSSFFASIKSVFSNFKKTIRKEQRRCLRYKKYKNKQSFCFVWAILNKYTKTFVVFIFGIILIGSIFSKNIFQQLSMGDFLGEKVQTSLIGDLTNKINNLKSEILDRQKCIEDEYWQPATKDVCNGYKYEQKNEHCAKFKVPTTKVAIGEKICCNEYGLYKGENKKKLEACPSATMFFNKIGDKKSNVVATKDNCFDDWDWGKHFCKFYPGNGFHAKLNEDGSIAYDENHNIILEKDCEKTQEVTACNKPCGGGQRYRTIQTANCLKIKTPELCNPEPCTRESN